MNRSVSVIIPAYNEIGNIRRAIEITQRALNQITTSSEIIIAEDGSTDGTSETAAEITMSNPNIRLLSSKSRMGRGRALTQAIKAARGDVICYLDADLATDMSHLAQLINAIRDDGYDFSTGSRFIKGSEVTRSKTRSFVSFCFNLMTRLLLHSELHDHQCGFKAFKRDSVLCILDNIKDNNWFWDTELLVRGQCCGYKIKEIPVRWREADSTSVRICNDSYRMGAQIVRLWWELRTGKINAHSEYEVLP